MRIIRVSGCHDCDAYATEIKTCVHPSRMSYGKAVFSISRYINNKTLPSNCPLEDALDFMVENAKDIVDEKLESVK